MTTVAETATCQCCGREWQRPACNVARRCFECRTRGCTYTWGDRPGSSRVYVHKEERP